MEPKIDIVAELISETEAINQSFVEEPLRVYRRRRVEPSTTDLSRVVAPSQTETAPSLQTESAPSLQTESAPSSQREKNIFLTRTSSLGLYSLLKQLSERQKEAVRDIGFGGLLSLDISKCPGELSRYIVRSFDCGMCAIKLQNGDMVRINEEDVQSVLDIPKGQLQISESTGSCNSTYAAQLKEWRRRWGILRNSGGPKTTEMPKRIVENIAADNNFKIDFVVYVVSSFLWTSQNQQCRFKILKSLFDVNNIKNLNWCKFTIEGLVDACKKWKKNEKSHFHGPHTFLLLCYLDRVVCPQLQLPYERQYPILSCWNDHKIKNRIQMELKEGGFGLGRDVGRLPLSNVRAAEGADVEHLSPNEGTDVESQIPTFVNAFRTLATSAKQHEIQPSTIFDTSIHILYEAMDNSSVLRDGIHKYFQRTPLVEEREPSEPEAVQKKRRRLILAESPPTEEVVVETTKELVVVKKEVESPPIEEVAVATTKELVVESVPITLTMKSIIENWTFLSLKDKTVMQYVYAKLDKKEHLYRTEFVTLTRYQIQTLTKFKSHVDAGVIDAWAEILNSKKVPGVQRIFFSNCAAVIAEHAEEELFSCTMKNEMNIFKISNDDFKIVDYIFFPICKDEHCFIICINTSKRQIQIIDNLPLPEGVDWRDQYKTVEAFVKMFVKFMEKVDSNLAASIAEYGVDVLHLEIQNQNWNTDCGVLCMLHMDAFRGEAGNFDNLPVSKYCNQKVIMKPVRLKLAGRILRHKINCHKQKLKQFSL